MSGQVWSTTGHASGQYYAEVIFGADTPDGAVGLYDEVADNGVMLLASGVIEVSVSGVVTGNYPVWPPLAVGDVVGIKADFDSGEVWFRVNGSNWNSPGHGLDLPLVAWEGGSEYWAQFPLADAAGWSEPTFFPIAVFLGKPAHAASLAAIGINTFMGIEHELPISDATEHVFVMASSPVSLPAEWTQEEVGDDPKVVGWFIADECEMGYSGCHIWPTDAEKLIHWNEWCEDTRAFDDGRFLFANFGNGVLNSFWAVQDGQSTMDQWMAPLDGCACDKYAYTSYNVQFVIDQSLDWPGSIEEAKSASAYGWFMDQMRGFDATNPSRRPIWGFFETKMPMLGEPDRAIILYAELAGAVWAAIVHEARGICYFHQNGFYETSYPGGPGPPAIDPNTGEAPTTEFYSLVDGQPELRAAVGLINAQLRDFAPVLNTQSYQWDFEAAGIDTMLKATDDHAYIFASVGIGGGTGSKTFTLPPDIAGDSVEVLNESRTLAVSGGQFSDSFAAEYAHHVYRIVR